MNVLKKIDFSKFQKDNLNEIIFFLSGIYPDQTIESITANTNRPPKNKIYIAHFNNKLIGTSWCLPLKFDNYYIGGIGGVAVHKNFRNKKVGAQLIMYLIENEIEFNTFLLWTRVPDFFKKLGFFDFSNGINRNKNDSLPMLKTEDIHLKSNFPYPKWRRIKF